VFEIIEVTWRRTLQALYITYRGEYGSQEQTLILSAKEILSMWLAKQEAAEHPLHSDGGDSLAESELSNASGAAYARPIRCYMANPLCPVCKTEMRQTRRGATLAKRGPCYVCPADEAEVHKDERGHLYRVGVHLAGVRAWEPHELRAHLTQRPPDLGQTGEISSNDDVAPSG